MSSGIKTYTVTIFNERYTLATDQEERYIAEAVNMIDSSMHAISKQISVSDPKKIAVLVALQLAEELITIRTEQGKANDTLSFILNQIEQLLHTI